MAYSEEVFQYFISGITTGSIYALVALGFTIIFNSTEILNFAQGEFVMLGGVLTVFFNNILQFPLFFASAISVALVFIIGILLERVSVAPFKKQSIFQMIIVTIGASIFLRGLVMLLFGKDTFSIPVFSSEEPVKILSATMPTQGLWILGITSFLLLAIKYFFSSTIFGKAISASCCEKKAASLVGINVEKMTILSFGISGALGAVSGIIITPITLVSFDSGMMIGLKGFAAAILGGLGNGTGAVLGGLCLGVLESLSAGLISSGYKDATAFLVLLLILYLKPNGLFSHKESDRV